MQFPFKKAIQDSALWPYVRPLVWSVHALLHKPKPMLDLRVLLKQYAIRVKGIVHVGAHQGKEINLYRSLGAQRILMIEANPEVFRRLKSNMLPFREVEVIQCAVSNVDGIAQLNVTSFDQASSLLKLKYVSTLYPGIVEVKQVAVESKTLDTLLAERQLAASDFNFLNVDIQGAELLAFQGAEGLLQEIDAINTEINFQELYEGCALAHQLDDFLAPFGFKRVATITPVDPSWGDALYVKDPRPVRGA